MGISGQSRGAPGTRWVQDSGSLWSSCRRLVGERATKRLRGGRGWGALALPQCLGSFFQAAAAAVRAGLSEIREGVDPTTPSCLLRPSGCSTVSWRASWDSTADDPERGLL